MSRIFNLLINIHWSSRFFMIPILLIYQCSTYHQKPWIQKLHFIKVLFTIINTKFRNCILSRFFLPSEALNSEIETLDGPQGELLGSGSPQCQAFPDVLRSGVQRWVATFLRLRSWIRASINFFAYKLCMEKHIIICMFYA